MRLHSGRRHIRNPRLGVGTVRYNSCLRPSQGHGGNSARLEADGQQGGCGLFSGGQQKIHLPLAWFRMKCPRHFKQTISHPAHCRHDDHQPVPLPPRLCNPVCHPLDPLQIGHRGSAVFLHQQSHMFTLPDF